MKKVSIILCSVMALMTCACEKPSPWRGREVVVEGRFSGDFYTRYPEAKVLSVNEIGDDKGLVVDFIDGDRFEKKAVYNEGGPSYTCRYYNVDALRSQLPERVLGTYLSMGLENIKFTRDNYSVFEIKREGVRQKQYEFHCVASFKDGDRMVSNMMCHIVISEDGTLLTFQHGGFNYSDTSYDLEYAIDAVHDMFIKDLDPENPEILGAIIDGMGDMYVYIRDKGIIKTIMLFPSWGNYGWRETRYSLLPSVTELPKYVLEENVKGDPENQGRKLYDVFMLETLDGSFYGTTFGTALVYHTHYVKVEM